jgi:polysaccharide biosynthesis/export protein
MRVILSCFVLVCSCLFTTVSARIIKLGDVLDIQVMAHPEFSGRFAVNDNGTVDYALLADVNVANISTPELMNDLTLRLARHIDNPLVLISVVEKPEIVVTVLGQVVKPGPVSAYEGTTVQEVVQMAGGSTPMAELERVKVLHRERPGNPEHFNLKQFMADGDVGQMPELRNGDMVILLSQERTNKVKVIGAVQKPGLFELEDKMNVFEIIYLAGGPAERADLSRVRRFSKTGEKNLEEVLDIQSYIDKGQMESVPDVTEGDVIIVYTRWFNWSTLMTVLNNALLVIVTVQALSGVFN